MNIDYDNNNININNVYGMTCMDWNVATERKLSK